MNLTNLRSKVYDGVRAKKIAITDVELDRIEHELSVIEEMKLVEYFWIYSMIAYICNQNNWLRTPGRNTNCGSLVSFCLDITKINPIEHNLSFERFINPLICEYADIDFDVPLGKKELLLYELKKLIPNYEFSFLAVIQDGNDSPRNKIIIEGVEYNEHGCAVIIKLIDNKINVTKATASGVNYYIIKDFKNDYSELDRYKYDITEQGYLSKLEVISNQLNPKYHPYKIKLTDKAIFKFLSSDIDLSNLFQFNKTLYKDAFHFFKPKNINELAMINSLARPSREHLIKQLIYNKSFGYEDNFESDARVDILLKETYGLLIYQETFLSLINVISGIEMQRAAWYSRVLMINRDVKNVNEFYIEFYNGCQQFSTLSDDDIKKLMKLIKENIRGLFLKSHALSYSTVSYWGAYYKVNFPKEFELAMSENN